MPTSITVLPSADVLNEAWSLAGTGVSSLWQAWDNDDDTKFAQCPPNKGRGRVSFPLDLSIPAGAIITDVSVYLRVAATDSDPTRAVTVNVLAADDTSVFTTRTISPTTSATTYPIGTYRIDPKHYAWDVHRLNQMHVQVFTYNYASVIKIYKFYAVVTYREAPTLTIVSPVGTVETPTPTLAWSYVQADRDIQKSAIYKIFSDDVVQGSGFDPDNSTAVYSSGVNGDIVSLTLTHALPPNTYWFYVQSVTSPGATSFWTSAQFVVDTPEPATPLLTVTADNDNSRAMIQVQDLSNLLSVEQADAEVPLDKIEYVATNCTLARDVASTTSLSTISYVGAATANSGSSQVSSLKVSRPSGVILGDVMFAITTQSTSTANPLPPSGWSGGPSSYQLTGAGNLRSAVYWKTAGANEPSSYTWSNDAAKYMTVTMVAYRGLDPGTPFTSHASGLVNGGTSCAVSPQTTTNSNQRVLSMMSAYSTTSSTTINGFAPDLLRVQDKAGTSGLYVLQGIADTGPGTPVGVHTETFTVSSATQQFTQWSFLLNPLAITTSSAAAYSLVGPPQATTTTTTTTTSDITFRAASSATSSAVTATSLVVNKPTGVVSGDLMIAMISAQSNAVTVTAPSGWSGGPATYQVVDSVNGHLTTTLYWRVAGSSEPTSYTWTVDTAKYLVGAIQAYTGCDPATPFAVLPTMTQTGTGTADTTPSVTSTDVHQWAVYGVAAAGTVTNTWTDTATQRAQSVAGASTTFASQAIADSGAAVSVGAHTATFTSSATESGFIAWSAVLNELVTTTTTTTTNPATTQPDFQVQSTLIEVAPNTAIITQAQFIASTTPRTITVSTFFVDGDNGFVDAGGSYTITGTDSTAGYTPFIGRGTTPVNATHAYITFGIASPVNAEQHDFDRVSLAYGTDPTASWVGGGFMSQNLLSGNYSGAPGYAAWTPNSNTTLTNLTSGITQPGAHPPSALQLTALNPGSVVATMTTPVDVSLVDKDVWNQCGGVMTLSASFLGSIVSTPFLRAYFYRANTLLKSPILKGTDFGTDIWTQSTATFHIPTGTTRVKLGVEIPNMNTNNSVSVDQLSIAFGNTQVWRSGTARPTHPIWLVPVIQYADQADGDSDFDDWAAVNGFSNKPPVYDPLTGSATFFDESIVPGVPRIYRVQTLCYGLQGDKFASDWVDNSANPVTITPTLWWLKDPSNDENRMSLTPYAEAISYSRSNTTTTYQPVGSDYPVVISEGFKKDTFKVKFIMDHEAFIDFEQMCDLNRPLLLQSNMDKMWWVRITGDPTADVILNTLSDWQTNPIRFVTVEFTEVQPES